MLELRIKSIRSDERIMGGEHAAKILEADRVRISVSTPLLLPTIHERTCQTVISLMPLTKSSLARLLDLWTSAFANSLA